MASNRRTNEARLLEPFLAKGPNELPDNSLGVAINDLYNTLSAHKVGADHSFLYFTKEEIANMILGAYNPNIMVPAVAGYGLVIEGNVIRTDLGTWEAWTPTVTGWAAGYTAVARYCKIGKIVWFEVYVTGTSDNASTSLTLPFTSATITGFNWSGACGSTSDNGTLQTTAARWAIASNTNVIAFLKDMANGAFTASGTKTIRAQGFYEIG